MKKDFLNKELNVGDVVAFTAPSYRSLVKGTIKSFTPQKVRISYVNTWNYGTPGRPDEILQYPEQIIKIEA
jgi:hypothetical protein